MSLKNTKNLDAFMKACWALKRVLDKMSPDARFEIKIDRYSDRVIKNQFYSQSFKDKMTQSIAIESGPTGIDRIFGQKYGVIDDPRYVPDLIVAECFTPEGWQTCCLACHSEGNRHGHKLAQHNGKYYCCAKLSLREKKDQHDADKCL